MCIYVIYGCDIDMYILLLIFYTYINIKLNKNNLIIIQI